VETSIYERRSNNRVNRIAEREWPICKGLRLAALTELPDTLWAFGAPAPRVLPALQKFTLNRVLNLEVGQLKAPK
jgi:hypothetical protein